MIWRTTPQPDHEIRRFTDTSYWAKQTALQGHKRKAEYAFLEEANSPKDSEYTITQEVGSCFAQDLKVQPPTRLLEVIDLDTKPMLEMEEWLLRAWKYDRQAHDTYCAQLLELGLCVRQMDTDRFDRTMAYCRRRLVRDQESRSLSPMPPPVDFREQFEDVQAWLMRRISRNAETLMMDLLVDLRRAAVRAVGAQDRAAVDSFYERKTACLCLGFYAFGGRI